MLHLANLCLFGILFLNLFGLALVTGLWLRNGWLALASGPWLFCSLGFFVESFFGLGRLDWLWPILSLVSVLLTLEVTGRLHLLTRWDKWLHLEEWKRELSPLNAPAPYAVFLGIFTYVMMWRYRYPNLDGSSEKIADVSIISSYLSGEKIPVHDVWLSPYVLTHYYSFQYYAAALMGRILGIDCGTAYNLAFCTIIALAAMGGIGVICQVTRKLWIRCLVSAGWIVGGSGITLIIKWTIQEPMLCNNFRYIGDPPYNQGPWGTVLGNYANQFMQVSPTTGEHYLLNLPGEPLSYSIYLGDYHPPLAGFYLLTLMLLSVHLWAKGATPWVLAITGACLPWCVVANTWNVPLETLGVAAWALYNFKSLYAGAWRYLVAGIVGAAVTIYPYYRLFALSAQDYNTAIRWVPWEQHTPPLLWLLFLLPTFALTILSLCSFNRTLVILGMTWLGFLFFTEFFFINDIYLGAFLRFNTTLKWWPWVAAGALLTMGPRLLEHLNFWSGRRLLALFFIAYPIFYFWDLAKFWVQVNGVNVGQLDGSGYLTTAIDNPKLNDRLLLNYLRLAPRGVVIERPDEDFTDYAGMMTLSGQQAYIGWVGHEQLWRGYLYEIQYRFDQVKLFYAGNMANAGEWMQSQGIDYILWFKPKTDTDELWDKANASLSTNYYWHEFYHDRGHRVGLWERKKAD